MQLKLFEYFKEDNTLFEELVRIFNKEENIQRLTEELKLLKSKGLLGDKYLRFIFEVDLDVLITPSGNESGKDDRRWYDWGMAKDGQIVTSKIPKTEKTSDVVLADVLENNPDEKYFLDKDKAEKLLKYFNTPYGGGNKEGGNEDE